MTQGAQPGALWHLDGGMGWGWVEAQEEGDPCVLMADPRCRMAATNPIL